MEGHQGVSKITEKLIEEALIEDFHRTKEMEAKGLLDDSDEEVLF